MKLSQYLPGAKRARFGAAAAATLVLLVAIPGSAQAATAVGLGTADSFVVLAGTGVTNTGPTTLNGDIGTFPTTTITDLGTITINGTNHAGDGVTQGAKTDLTTAYDAAAGQGPTNPIAAALDGQTLVPGVYNSASQILLNGGAVTLDAGGNAAAVWVFQAGSDLIVGNGSVVNLTNGAQACNVFWQVGSSGDRGIRECSEVPAERGRAGVGDTLAGQGPTLPIAAALDGQTLVPGVYNSASQILLNGGAVTLDAGGDAAAVWVFQAGSDLIVGNGSVVNLTNGAQACNVFWQVGSSASLGTSVAFRGTIMALTSITLATAATLEGRALARNGTVTLDTNTITRPICAAAPAPSAAAQVTATPTGAVSTGDGSTSGGTDVGPYLLTAALVLAGVGGTAVLVARRRRQV